MIEEPSYDPETLDQAAEAFTLASGALDTDSLNNGGGVGAINNTANEIRAQQIESSPAADTVEGKAQIATLRGNTQVAEGWNWVLQNQDKVQLVNGVPQLKPEYANQPPVSPRVSSPAEKLGIAALGPLGTIANAFSFLAQPNIGMDLTAAQEKIMTPEQKALRATQVAATPQAQQYQATGYPSGVNTFFRNIGENQPQATWMKPMTGLSTYLGTQATVTPVIPPPPKPTMPQAPAPKITPVKKFTPQEIQQSLIDFRAGERNI
jgi:hypothetical protein